MLEERVAPSPFALFALEWLKPGARLIELGCGSGLDLMLFASHGINVVGVDKDAECLKAASECCQVIQADVMALSDTPAEAIYARWLLHVLTEEEQERVLDWCARCLSAGGLLFIEARSAAGEHPSDHYRRPLDLEALCASLERRGFVIDYRAESDQFSVRGDDYPMLLRVVARKP